MQKLHKPECTRGECECDECLLKKLELLRACETEFADSTEMVRYRKYMKMPRTRSDGRNCSSQRTHPCGKSSPDAPMGSS